MCATIGDAKDNTLMCLEGGQGSQRGYAMAALLVSLGVMLVLMTVAMPVWRTQAQREKEAELVFRGEQIARAINLYMRKMGGGNYPPSLDVLVQGRFLRKKYKDPMTKDGEWDVILAAGGVPGQGGPAQPQPGRSGLGGAPSTGLSAPPSAQLRPEQCIALLGGPGGRRNHGCSEQEQGVVVPALQRKRHPLQRVAVPVQQRQQSPGRSRRPRRHPDFRGAGTRCLVMPIGPGDVEASPAPDRDRVVLGPGPGRISDRARRTRHRRQEADSLICPLRRLAALGWTSRIRPDAAGSFR